MRFFSAFRHFCRLILLVEEVVMQKSLGTHDGLFHADEVTACALLLHYGQVYRDKIIRTRDTSILETCDFVCDVGGIYNPEKKRFDHHQVSYKGSMSSAGMVCKWLFDQKIIGQELYDYLKDQFVSGVDENDNGLSDSAKGHSSFSDIVDSFNPPGYNAAPSEIEASFNRALDFVLGYIGRLIEKYRAAYASLYEVKRAMERDSDLLEFDSAMPWSESFFVLGGEGHRAKFVLMPIGNQWKLRAIPPTEEERMSVRMAHPAAWGGLRGAALEKVSGLSGAVFCHKGLFISIWESREAALAAFDKIMEAPSTAFQTVFGKIVRAEIPATIVFENKRFIVIKDINPQTPVHLLIIPKREIRDIQSIERRDTSLMSDLLLVVQEMAVQFKIENGYRLLTNCGPLAGQSVFHLHFHLMGGRALNWDN